MDMDAYQGDDTYYGQSWVDGDQGAMASSWNIEQGYYSTAPDANRQVVAQRSSGSNIEPPKWDGTPASFDIFKKRVLDWTLQTKTHDKKVGHQVLHHSIPTKPRERLRSTISIERLEASSWREAVSADDTVIWKTRNEYTPNLVKHQAILSEIRSQRNFQVAILAKSSGVAVDQIPGEVVEQAVRVALGDRYVEEPVMPTVENVSETPEGTHSVFGNHFERTYGDKKSCGVRYLIELLEATQMVKPVHRYLNRLRKFLNCRRPHKGSITAYVNEYLTLKAELLSDKTVKGFDIPDKLSALLMLSFASITDQEYTIVMAQIGGLTDLDTLTEDKVQSVLTEILGDRDTQKSRAYWVDQLDQTPSSTSVFGTWEDSGYEEEHYQHNLDDSQIAEWAFWSEVLECVEKDRDPPFLPDERTAFVDENDCRWQWEDESQTYIGEVYDTEAECYRAQAGKKGKRGGKRMRRRFPRRGKNGRAKGMQATAEQAREMCNWYEEAYFGGKGKGGGQRQGWYGPWLDREKFFEKLRSKGKGSSKGKSFSSGKFSSKGKGKGGGKRPPVRSAFFVHQFENTSQGLGRDKSGARAARRGNRHKHRSLGGWLVPQPRREKAFIAPGYAVMDPGCTKAVTSEYYKRKLMEKLKESGIKDGEVGTRPSTTAYSFADGEGKISASGYRSDMVHVLGGREFTSEWEVLPKGNAPPLFSLEQHENLRLDISYRPDSEGGSRVSSSVLGWKDRPILKDSGHHVINLVDVQSSGSALLAQGDAAHPGDRDPSVGSSPAGLDSVQGPLNAEVAGVDVETSTSGWSDSDVDSVQLDDSDAGGADSVLAAQAKDLFCGEDIKRVDPTVKWSQEDLTQFCLSCKQSDFQVPDDHLKNNEVSKPVKTSAVNHASQVQACGSTGKVAFSAVSSEPKVNENATANNEQNPKILEKLDQLEKSDENLKNLGFDQKIFKENFIGPYSVAEILKMHYQWYHCSAGQIIKRLKCLDLPTKNLNFEVIQKILQRCPFEQCQNKKPRPPKPQGSGLIPHDRNWFVCQDTFYPQVAKFEGGVQHQIDALTKVNVLTLNDGRGASVRDANKAADIWDSFYGPPKYRLTDNGPEYTEQYTERCCRVGSEHKTTPTYSAFSNGIIERAHQKAEYLIAIVAAEHPKATPKEVLSIVQVAMNSEVKKNGQTPLSMTLGRPIPTSDFEENAALWEDAVDKYQELREAMLNSARIALLKFQTDENVKKSLRSKLAKQRGDFSVGSSVWWYRMGKPNTKDQWMGPAKVLCIRGRLVIIQYGSVCSIVHESRIRPYYPYGNSTSTTNDVSLEHLPKQTRGRHLVQNQGELRLDVIREDQVPLDLLAEPRPDPIAPVLDSAGGIPESVDEPSPDPPEATPPPRRSTEHFEIFTKSDSEGPDTSYPEPSPSVHRSEEEINWLDDSPDPSDKPITFRPISKIKEELGRVGVSDSGVAPHDSGSGLHHPPTRHSPEKFVQRPWPAQPLPSKRISKVPKRFDPAPENPKHARLVDVVGGEEGDSGEKDLGSLFQKFELETAMFNIDKRLQRIADKNFNDINSLEADIASLTKIHEALETSRLEQDATPMRELSEEEKEKYKGLVEVARDSEYSSFFDEDTFRIIPRKDIPPHPDGSKRRIVTSRELCQWKQYLQKVKIRVVLRGFQDDRRRAPFRSVDSPTLRSDSLRMIFQLAADQDQDIWAWDLKAAFLQGLYYDEESDLVYWNPPPLFRKYFGMKENEVCVAIKSIYGLNDAPRKWYERLAEMLIKDISDWTNFSEGGFGATRHWLDSCLFMKHDGGKFDGRPLTPEELPEFKDAAVAGSRRYPSNLRGTKCTLAAGSHVDDIIATGTKDELEALDRFLRKVFKVGTLAKASGKEGIKYRGLRIRLPEPCHIIVDMAEYEEREVHPLYFPDLPKRVSQKRKDVLLDDEGQARYRAINGKLIWCVCNVRVECQCRVSQSSSKLGKATESDAIFINKILDYLRTTPREINYYRIADPKVPRCLRATCDAAFRRKDEMDDRSRGGYLLCIGTRENDLVGLISYGSAKLNRVCKSPTGAEAVTISACGDQLDLLYHIFFWFYPNADPTGEILTDSYSVTSSQMKYCGDVSPNLLPDFALIRQRVRDGAVVMKHQLGQFMAADGMTKATNEALKPLLEFLETNRLGAEGVDMPKIAKKVESRLARAFTAGKIMPHSLDPIFIERLADAAHLEIINPEKNSKYFLDGQIIA